MGGTRGRLSDASLQMRFAHFLTDICANIIAISGESESGAGLVERLFPALYAEIMAHIRRMT